MNSLEKLNRLVGFTKNEMRIVFFLAAVLIVGSGIKIYKYISTNDNNPVFNYTETDKTFNELSKNSLIDTTFISEVEDEKKFNKKVKLKPRSININKAGKTELMKLPGIGEIMADRIIEYREENGLFKEFDELLKVKGIGKKKLDRMLPFIILDK